MHECLRADADCLDDAVLLPRAKSGDREALGELLRRHEPKARDGLRRFRLQPADCDDIYQEAVCSVLLSIEHCEPDTHFHTWFSQILQRRTMDFFRYRGAKKRDPRREESIGQLGIDLVDGGEPSDAPALYADFMGVVERAGKSLPRTELIALIQSAQGKDYSELFADCSERTARRRVNHARKEVAGRLPALLSANGYGHLIPLISSDNPQSARLPGDPPRAAPRAHRSAVGGAPVGGLSRPGTPA